MKKITSHRNPLIKDYLKCLQGKASLSEHNNRLANNRLAVEGFNLLEEALAKKFPIETLFFCPEVASEEPLRALLDAVNPETEVMQITPSLLKRITLTENPQGVAGVVVYPEYSWHDILSATSFYGVLVDRLQDPGNLGTIIRTAAAAGFTAVICTPGTVNPFNPKVIRSSAGSLFHLKICKNKEPATFLSELKKKRVAIVSTEIDSDQAYYQVNYKQPILLMVGNEREGVSQSLASMADHRIRIPIEEGVDSLNAAVAAGVVMFEARRQNQN